MELRCAGLCINESRTPQNASPRLLEDELSSSARGATRRRAGSRCCRAGTGEGPVVDVRHTGNVGLVAAQRTLYKSGKSGKKKVPGGVRASRQFLQ